MISTNKTRITKDPSGKKLIVTRDFNAPLEKVWQAWTERNLLDKWWAPKPWKTETKSMDFKPNGTWLYAMVGPEGEKHWCRLDFKTINSQKSITAVDAFCDENGNPTNEIPSMHWHTSFSSSKTGTTVRVEITFDQEADLEKIIEMGFKEGFTLALGNLDKMLNKFSKVFIPFVLVVILIGLVVAIIPMKINRKNSAEVKAIVTNVSQGGMKDIVISLEGIRGIYYISRVTKKDLTADMLNEKLANRKVTISYAKPRALSLLNPMTNTIQITELKLGNEVIFSEFQ